MNVLDVKVSIFKNYNSPDAPQEVSLLTWLKSAKYQKEVETIRATADKEERDRLKAGLPAITPSGIFSRREEAGLVKHSGLIQIDIDLKENQHIANFPAIKEQLQKLPEIAYLGLSVSGKGFWGLVPLTFPERHKEQFEALKRDFAKWGLVLDEKPKNVASLRGYSYDTEAYFNPQAKPYCKIWKPQPEVYRGQYSTATGNEAEKVEACLAGIEAGRIDITGSYSEWFSLGCSLANEFGEAGRGYFHRASQYYPGYSSTEADKQFSYCLRRRYSYSIGTFYQICQDYGITFREHFQKAPRIEQPASSPAGNATAQTEALPAELQEGQIRPQEESRPEPGPTTPQQEEQAPEGPGQAQGTLPAGFAVVERTGGNVLEVDGLPLEWLNEAETAEAQERAKGYELEIFEQLNPDVSELVERFGLEVEEVLPAG